MTAASSPDPEQTNPERPSPHNVTRLLSRAAEGSQDAFRELFPLVYDELRRLADNLLAKENSGHTLQPTALVHEAYLKLLRQESAGCRNRGEFMGIAAQAMRRLLVDHARAKRRGKRGGGEPQGLLDEAVAVFEERAHDLVELDEALTRLKSLDERKARIVELRFFAGLDPRDVSEALGVPLRTCERDWSMARAWLRKELAG